MLEYVWMFLGYALASLILVAIIGLPILAFITVKEWLAAKKFKDEHPNGSVLKDD